MKFISFGVMVFSAHLIATQQSPTTAAVPDLEGVWNFATLTPLERPAQLADQEFLTESEAAAFVRDTLERNNRDRRDGGAEVDVARAVNDGWFDRGTSLARVNGRLRTSLITNPPNGRLPALTPLLAPGSPRRPRKTGSIPPTDRKTDRFRSAALRSMPGHRFSRARITTTCRYPSSRTTSCC
jgi:hypothetical protein